MHMISEQEKQRRRRAVASSQGSLAMEGQQLDTQTVELSRRYAEGELTLSEFGVLMEQHAHDVVERLKGQRLRVPAA